MKKVSTADRRTRDRVARLLLARGPQTAAELSAALGLTPAGIRRHLDAMVEAGQVSSRPTRAFGPRGRGRPARSFALTDAGHAAMPNAYDDIATAALRYLAAESGEVAVVEFARARVSEFEARYGPRLEAAAAPDRASVLAEALSAEGYAAATRPAAAGVQLCQHHCPVQHVAEQFPQLCEAETQAFSRLLGSHVQRLATIAHGDGVCTTHIPRIPAERTSS